MEEREKTKKKNKPAKKKTRRRRRSESKVIRVFLIFYQKTGQNFNYTKNWTKKLKRVMTWIWHRKTLLFMWSKPNPF